MKKLQNTAKEISKNLTTKKLTAPGKSPAPLTPPPPSASARTSTLSAVASRFRFSRAIFRSPRSTRKVSFWYGGRTRRELFYIEQFREIEKQFPNFKFYVALDNPLPEDNWQVKENMDAPGDGFKGFIMPVLNEQYLKNHPEPEELEYYFCGPPLMNASVIKTLDELGVTESNIAFDDFGG